MQSSKARAAFREFLWQKYDQDPEVIRRYCKRIISMLKDFGYPTNGSLFRLSPKIYSSSKYDCATIIMLLNDKDFNGYYWWDKSMALKDRLMSNAHHVFIDFENLEVLDFELSISGY